MENESEFSHTLLLVAAIFLFIKVWPRLRMFVTMWRLRLTPDRFVLTEIPASGVEQVLLSAGAAALEPLGFVHTFSFDIETDGRKQRYDYYAQPSMPGTSALVTRPLQSAQRPYDVNFQTRFRSAAGEEFLLETFGGAEGLYGDKLLPHVAYLGSVSANEQWQRHQERIEETEAAGSRRILEDPGTGYIEDAAKWSQKWIQDRLEDGSYVRNGDGSYRHSAAAAFAIMKRTGAAKNAALNSVLESADPSHPDAIRLEAARCSMMRMSKENERSPGYLILFAISLVASVVGLWLWAGWETAVFLTVVIFVHELGHFLGMKICGYRDARIFFLPMLGGVATGKKSDPTPTQELLVLLLGPLPGLILGIIATAAYWKMESLPDWIFELASVSVAVNYLNLLPVMPLDGGRIVNTLFMRRYPRLQFVFSILSIFAFVAGAFALGSVLLGMFAVFGVLRLRAEWLNGTIEKEVIPQLTTDVPDPEETTLLVVQTMRRHTLPEPLRPLPTRIALVNQIVAALSHTKASIAVMVIGTSVYLFSLVVPLFAYVAILVLFSGEFDAGDFESGDPDVDESVIEVQEEGGFAR